jgi:hypothetical protein
MDRMLSTNTFSSSFNLSIQQIQIQTASYATQKKLQIYTAYRILQNALTRRIEEELKKN